jgi:excinuclease ABC subunit A
MIDQIIIRGARLHNLKNVSLSIPKNRFVVLTGLSGSGKSTLGFDILLKEGQRQYMESLGMAAMGLSKPPVDAITGLSPAISVDQHLTNHSPRSTVGTVTDVYTYLRILFARLGSRPCPNCGKTIPPTGTSSDMEEDADAGTDDDSEASGETVACPHCGASVPALIMASFSFNKPEGACPTCTGLGSVHTAELASLVDEHKSILDGGVIPWDGFWIDYYSGVLKAAATYYGMKFDPSLPIIDYAQPMRDLLFYGVEAREFRRHFPHKEPPTNVRQGRFEGIATSILRRFTEHMQSHTGEADYRDQLSDFVTTRTCPDCGGARLKPESREVTVAGQTIMQVTNLPLVDLGAWLRELPAGLSADEQIIAEPVLAELDSRITRLIDVGAGYLSPDRASTTLSAGESQRLRLASLLGSELSGVLYVFDEPTIGLHPRDTHRLIDVLRRLRDLGNTILVIEHDLEMISAADFVVDVGPGAGKHGGQIVAVGSPAEVAAVSASLTGGYLSRREAIALPQHRRTDTGRAITVRGAREHNLKDLTVRFPLGMLVAVTGVSGSGKSTLVFDILDRALRQRINGASDIPGAHDAIDGLGLVDRIITIDQEHIGRMPRSNAATYSDAFTPIREAYARTPEAKKLGFAARHFSFNVPGGRCPRCEGSGVLTVKMQLLPDVEVRCPACHGHRFTRETLTVKYHGRDISEALDMTVEEALALFDDVPAARSRLQVLSDVGLGYLQLGQPATTLSGGEAQRVKLAKELGRRTNGRALYLLDEPTTGLHLADTARLLDVLQRLVDAGSTVIVVEHNLEVIKTADWVIDLGPEGGAGGGQLMAEGTPEQVAQAAGSQTGYCLAGLVRV